jgi:hypothetical protein
MHMLHDVGFAKCVKLDVSACRDEKRVAQLLMAAAVGLSAKLT